MMSVSAGVFVCPGAYFWNYVSPMAVARSYSGGVEIPHVLPILSITLCLNIMSHMEACRCRFSE